MGEPPKKKSGIFSSLSDDLLGQVVNKVKDRKDRKSFSLVCKQWLKVEGLDRSKLTLYVRKSRNFLHALTRFPNIVKLWICNCKIHTNLEFVAKTCPKIESILIECEEEKQNGDGGILSPKGLCALGVGCPKLTHVEISGTNAIGNSGVIELLNSAHNLESLVLQYNELISDEGLSAIGSTSSISILELDNCYSITNDGLASLANGSTSKTLKKLIIHSAPKLSKITDTGVEVLHKMCRLEYLELSLWRTRSGITDIGGVGITAIRTLKELTLNYLDVSDPTMIALAQNCRNLEKLNIRGCKKVTGAGIRAFCGHKCLKCLILDELKINLADVEWIVFGCPALDSVVVDHRRKLDPTWSDELMHDKARKVVRYVVDYCLDEI